MRLHELEAIVPGSISSRSDGLESFRNMLMEDFGFDVEPISYHDMECFWVRIKTPRGQYNLAPDHWDSFVVEYLTDLLKT